MTTTGGGSDVDHVILTRFNLPSPGPESLIRAQDGWLRGRVELFERYCLPSVAAQTVQDFSWIVYFDPESPPWLRERIEHWTRTGPITALYRERVPPEDLLADLATVSGRRHPRVLTTNLDNDDGLAVDFVERLQRGAADRADRTAVYYPVGLIAAPTGVYIRIDRRNAFCSVQEPWAGAVTCWSEWHNLLADRMPVLEVDGPPGWLQVIHQTNVSNRVRGRLTSPTPHRARFGSALSEVAEPGRRRLAYDLVLGAPLRAGRDGARGTVKNLLYRVLGKAGLDRLKLTLAMARTRLRRLH